MMDLRVQVVAERLMARGHYESDDPKYPMSVEQPDVAEWLRADAENVVTCIDAKGDTIPVIWDALVDTGLHDPTQDTERRCLAADVETIVEGLMELLP